MFSFFINNFETISKYIGLFVFANLIVNTCARLVYIFSLFIFAPGAVHFKDYGDWAIITGSTDGIGRSFADHLAKHGLNIVLISRNYKKLQNQSDELKEKYPSIETIIIVADFSGNTIIIFNALLKSNELNL